MSNVSENLFQAMDIIIAERLNGLNYDKTILCKIEDDSKKDKGEYIVTDGSSTFVAISKDASYIKGSSVYVTVPIGDFNQQKLIVGKYIANNEQYATYQAPFELYIDITENLIEDNISTGLLANGEISEKLIWSWYKPQGQGLRGYTRLGFNAKFRSWLAALEPIAGTYGIRIDVEGTEKTTTEESDIHKNYKFYLTSDEFYGDPYNFDVFYKQEKVFDISKIAEVTRIQVTFYQDSGSFINKDKDTIVAKDDEGNALLDNLWIDEVFLSVGYATQDFDYDTVLLYTFDSLTYAAESETKKKADGRPLNEKNLKARWIHFDEEGKCTAIDNEAEMADYEENHSAKIHWYKHVLQDGVCDDLAGNFWQEVNDDQTSKNLLYTFNPDITTATETYKVIVEMPSRSSVNEQIEDETWNLYQKWGIENPTEENIEAWRTATEEVEDPDTGDILTRVDAVLKIDEILTELSTTLLATVQYYESDTFVFSNEAQVPDQATLELVQGLSIIVDAVGLKGNYCIYGQTNEILNSSEGHKMRTLEARYESLITNDARLDKASTIRWKIPAFGTMIYKPEQGKEYIARVDEDDETYDEANELLYASRSGLINGVEQAFMDEDGNLIPVDGYYIIERKGTEEYPTDADEDGVQDTVEQISVMQDFRIESYYTPQNTNNTVHCEILKNGLTYKASSTLVFGPQGTNGTDSTLVLKFKDDQSAIDKDGEITVEAHLYDYNNTEVQIDTDSISWLWWKNDDGYEAKDSVLKIGGTNWVEKTIVSAETDAAGNELSTSQTITYPEVKIQWDSNDATEALHNILQCNVRYGSATIGAQAVDGVDLEENEALKEEVVTRAVNLQAFIPIPFRDNPSLTWAEVPTRIVYDDQGKNPTYYKNAFVITTSGSVEGYVSSAEIIWDDDTGNKRNEGNKIYYPSIKQRGPESSAPGFYLEPKNMYFSGLSNKVTLKVVVAFNNSGQITYYNWYQPILIIQNRWPSAMMNAWDGSLTIDEKNGTILSTMMGAGKKEDDNTFTGVLMGDIATGAGYADKQLGVYGFNHGQQSFGFKDDGTAFIGKAGKGRIVFDGNSGTIASMSRSQNEKAGMLIDLDDGFIDIMGVDKTGGVTGDNSDTTNPVYKESGAHVRIDVKDPYLSITTAAEDGHLNSSNVKVPSEIMHVGVGEYFLQSADYSTSAKIGTRFDINKGQYISYDPRGNGDYIKISSEGNPFLQIYHATSKESLMYVGDRSFYLQSPDFKDKKGMKIDIINSTIQAYDKNGNGDYIKITGQGTPFLQVYDKNDGSDTGTSIIYCGEGSFYMQSSNYSATNGGLKIDFKQGRMEGGTNTESGGNKRWKIENDGSATFAHITATTGGQIGPFYINSSALYTGSASLGGTGVYLGSSGLSVSSGKFKVDSSGNTTLTGVITGTKWNITAEGLATFENLVAKETGEIGPFKIDATGLYIGTASIESTAYLGSSGIGVGEGKFKVDSSGNVTLDGTINGNQWEVDKDGKATFENIDATGGKIGKWEIEANGLKGGSLFLNGTNGYIQAYDGATAYIDMDATSIWIRGNVYTGWQDTSATLTCRGKFKSTSTANFDGDVYVNKTLYIKRNGNYVDIVTFINDEMDTIWDKIGNLFGGGDK